MPELLPMRGAGVRLVRAGTEHALVNDMDERRHVLNETALALWELCDGATRPDEMVEAICTLFGTARAQIEVDVQRILGEFSDRDLIDWRDEGSR